MENYKISQRLQVFEQNAEELLIYNERTKKSCVLNKLSYEVLQIFDGTRTVEQAACLCGMEEKMPIFQKLIEKFDNMCLFEQSQYKKRFKLLKIKAGLLYAKQLGWFRKEKRWIKIMSQIIEYLPLPILMVGILLEKDNLMQISLLTDLKPNQLNIPMILILYFIMVVLHEFGHAVIAADNGAHIVEMGIMLYCFLPCAYTSICGMTLVDSGKKRIKFALAGILMNCLLAGISLILMYVLHQSSRMELYIFVLLNLVSIIGNLIVFVKLDGYYVIRELVDLDFEKKNTEQIPDAALEKTKEFLFKGAGVLFIANSLYLLIYQLFCKGIN